ncbi:hypothetical protein F511_22238 [Dorcoceras hygrometricum]|uniref:Uncharacterized protein n=1 Tax=Dorcoceras hygrometricum TaxID=472368 RepID=A0A2Z7C262_9LAMI|nr:hypothetical protein F511_22238 [Dorcoceras hygrometricum]
MLATGIEKSARSFSIRFLTFFSRVMLRFSATEDAPRLLVVPLICCDLIERWRLTFHRAFPGRSQILDDVAAFAVVMCDRVAP